MRSLLLPFSLVPLLLLLLGGGCGSSSPPPPSTPATEAAPATAPVQAAPASEPAAAAPRTTTPAPPDPRCPTTWTNQMVDAACADEGLVCRGEICRGATGFCNLMVCRKGRWSAVEVPPPAPAP